MTERLRYSAGVEMVTPAKAKAWLATGTGNRGYVSGDKRVVSETRVAEFEGILRRGEWELTNDAATFTESGRLVNAFHRLTAIANTGITAPMAVVRGVSESAYEVMDRGQKRTLNQILKDRGFHYTACLSSVVNDAFKVAQGIRLSTRTHHRPTPRQALQFIDDNPEIVQAAADGQLLCGKLRCNATAAGLARFWTMLVDQEDSDLFFAELSGGDGLRASDPIFQLRERLMADGRGPKALTLTEQAALIIKAWNLYRRGESVRVLSWRGGGSSPEAFPEPI